jgi:hypothetical protein
MLFSSASPLNAGMASQCLHEVAPTQDKIDFWNTTKRGANIFNTHVSSEDIRAAKIYGIQFIRLSLDKFPSKKRDFLMGNADRYHALDPDDLAHLKAMLDRFTQENMPIVITVLGLPGSRWEQLNGDQDDLRIWSDEEFQRQATCFWRDLAKELRTYSIVIGYNILNEPHPERLFNTKSCHIDRVNQTEVQRLLFDFNSRIIRGIREVDPHTPIVIDSSSYADPNTFKQLQPLEDARIIYSFHMYEPYRYTSHKHYQEPYRYPGNIAGKYWDKTALREYMQAINDFQTQHKIPPNRIFVGEFGCYRLREGLPGYFSDLIAIFEENKWHWAFYAFRDNWDGMDYELGDKKLPWEYQQAYEKGENFSWERQATCPQFAVLKEALDRPSAPGN